MATRRTRWPITRHVRARLALLRASHGCALIRHIHCLLWRTGCENIRHVMQNSKTNARICHEYYVVIQSCEWQLGHHFRLLTVPSKSFPRRVMISDPDVPTSTPLFPKPTTHSSFPHPGHHCRPCLSSMVCASFSRHQHVAFPSPSL